MIELWAALIGRGSETLAATSNERLAKTSSADDVLIFVSLSTDPPDTACTIVYDITAWIYY